MSFLKEKANKEWESFYDGVKDQLIVKETGTFSNIITIERDEISKNGLFEMNENELTTYIETHYSKDIQRALGKLIKMTIEGNEEQIKSTLKMYENIWEVEEIKMLSTTKAEVTVFDYNHNREGIFVVKFPK